MASPALVIHAEPEETLQAALCRRRMVGADCMPNGQERTA
jgi:hypothetical protein